MKLPIKDDDFILNYGSQLFLQETNALLTRGADLSINAEAIEPYFDDFLFCEVLIHGKYLTKLFDKIALKEESTSASIWSIEMIEKDKIKIINIVDRSYIGVNKDTNNLISTNSNSIYTTFHINPHSQPSHYLLQPLNPLHTKSGSLSSLSLT